LYSKNAKISNSITSNDMQLIRRLVVVILTERYDFVTIYTKHEQLADLIYENGKFTKTQKFKLVMLLEAEF